MTNASARSGRDAERRGLAQLKLLLRLAQRPEVADRRLGVAEREREEAEDVRAARREREVAELLCLPVAGLARARGQRRPGRGAPSTSAAVQRPAGSAFHRSVPSVSSSVPCA